MPLRTQRIDINPLRDFRYVANATRYTALDMFASQTRDLYHIETVRKGGYIEFAARQIYRAEPGEAYRQIAFVHTNAKLVIKRKSNLLKRRKSMFSLFSKKFMNEAAARTFWAWFEEQELWIINCLSNHDSAFVWAIDERLKPVFPYFKKELEFQLGYNEGKGEFFFFHFGNKNLIKDADAFARMMPKNISERWTFIAEK